MPLCYYIEEVSYCSSALDKYRHSFLRGELAHSLFTSISHNQAVSRHSGCGVVTKSMDSSSSPLQSSPSSPLLFRSILPHEPPPTESLGYIYVQGAFSPKIKTSKLKESDGGGEFDKEEDEDASKKEESSSSASSSSYLWTKESLEDAIFKILAKGGGEEHEDHAILGGLALPFSVQQVQVLDPEPPFTKVRLVYESPAAASCMVSAFRRRSLTPAQLFQDYHKSSFRNNSTDEYITFSSRPLQWTRITRQPLTEPSWPRSTPPKFRRLLPRPGEDLAILEQERQTTRFVFITNLLLQEQSSNKSAAANESSRVAISATGDCSFGENALLTAEAIRSIVNAFDTSSSSSGNGAGGVEVFLNAKKMPLYCHVGMRSASDAQRLIQGLQGQQVTWKWTNATSPELQKQQQNGNDISQYCVATSGKLFLDFADITHRSAKRDMLRSLGLPVGDEKGQPAGSTCTSVTSHVVVPGLQVLENFISSEEEEVLIAVLTGPHAPWAPLQSTPAGGTVKRKVQHYGYVFDYQTANVLRDRVEDDRAKCPPMPSIAVASKRTKQRVTSSANHAAYRDTEETLEEYMERCVREGRGWELLAGVIERTRRHEFSNDASSSSSFLQASLSYPNINQMTLNHYLPGEGIGSHIDTPSAFGDGLMSITLNGGTVMEFRKVVHDDNDEERQPPNGSNSGNSKSSNNLKKNPLDRKLVYLPRRSLVLMSGPARYSWEHYICSRMTDTHNGQVLPRSLRVSLTLRTALDVNGSSPMPRVQSSIFPPRWGDNSICAASKSDGEISSSSSSLQLATPDCERDHVHAVYDAIATQWHHTRGRRGVLWPGATQFLQRLPPGSIVADVGCGDGKYFPAIWQAGSYVIGTDISLPLLETAIPPPGNTATEEDEEEEELATPESRRVSQEHRHLREHPAVIVADCMSVPLRSSSCDAAICIAVLHHLSTRDRRIQCIRELGRIVRPGGTINIQAWAMEQEEGSRRKFASEDVYVPFNVQPKYLSLNNEDKELPADDTAGTDAMDVDKQTATTSVKNGGNQSTAQAYSKAFQNAEYDDTKGLVVFKRYCHLYRQGEMEELVSQVENVELLESGFESGNHFVILRVKS
jgi:alkylated DNA repair dioxygenase AlkB/SAM-dependent methyltransferase